MPLKTLNTLLRVVIEQGYPLEQALEQIGLDFNPLLPENQQRQEVPTSCYSKLYRLLMELLQDEAFGLGQEYHAPPGTFRMMCLFIIHCPTLHQALIRSWEFHDYCNQYRGIPRRRGSRPVVYLDNGESALCLFQRSVSSEQDRDFVGHANVLLMMFRFYSWLIGKRLPLQAVHLRARAPASSKHYEQLFGCEVRFEQAHSGLLIPAGVLQYPVAQNEESLREFLRQAPYQLVKHEQPASVQSLTRRIEQLLSQYASQKLPNADEVARQLNMSPRTLHRKLTAEDTLSHRTGRALRQSAGTDHRRHRHTDGFPGQLRFLPLLQEMDRRFPRAISPGAGRRRGSPCLTAPNIGKKKHFLTGCSLYTGANPCWRPCRTNSYSATPCTWRTATGPQASSTISVNWPTPADYP
jgi:AraC-like DNA-binding protein